MGILLDEDEIENLWTSYDRKTWEIDEILHNVAKVQLKKVIEWGEELDWEHNKGGSSMTVPYRYECPKCWHKLKEEVISK